MRVSPLVSQCFSVPPHAHKSLREKAEDPEPPIHSGAQLSAQMPLLRSAAGTCIKQISPCANRHRRGVQKIE